MLASLVALLVSLAFVVASPDRRDFGDLPPRLALAFVKLLALLLVFRRVRESNLYSMQWSSMFILLFVAEGVVRATTDPQPAALLGALESVAAATYFGAVLTYLRPFKQQAKADRKKPP